MVVTLLVLLPRIYAQEKWGIPVPPEAEYPFKRDMEKGKYDKAEEKIKRRISRDSNNLECHYAAYRLYSDSQFPRRNLDTAYFHLLRVRVLYEKADEKELERWARDSYSGARIDYDLRQLGCLAISHAHSLRTPDAYQHIINHYTLIPHVLRDSAVNSRDSLEFDIARRSLDIQTIQAFIDRRPASLVLHDATMFRDSLAFAYADSRHTYAAYQHFRVTYPNSHLYNRATDSVYTIEYRDALVHNSEQYYRGYAERYPASPQAQQCLWLADSIEYHREVDINDWQSLIHYIDTRNRPNWKDTAALRLAYLSLRLHHIPAARRAVFLLPKGSIYRDSLATLLHKAYLHTSITNFDHFYKSPLAQLVSPQQRQSDSLALKLYNNYDYSIIDSCIRTIAPYHEAYLLLQQRIKDDIDHGRWNNAVATVDSYASYFGDDYDFRQLLSTLSSKTEPNIKPTPLGPNVNTPKGDEYAPVISADEQTLYFAARNRTENIGGEDVFVTHKKGGKWGTPTIEMDLSHTYGNEAPTSVSADGSSLLIYQSGTLFQADLTPDGWQMNRLPATINSGTWKSDASFAANGRALLFAAKRLTTHEADSSLNLFVSLLDDNDRWGRPIELGPVVNTPFDERSPYLHPDMRTLYFSSEGHGSMGQMDLFMTIRLDDTWTHWSAPINVGKEFNTSGDDWGHKIAADGSKSYYARSTNNSLNLFSIPLPHRARPNPVTIITGTVSNTAGLPVSTLLCWESLSSGRPLGQCRSTADGHFTLILPYGEEYGLYICDSDYFPSSQTIDLRDKNTNLPIRLEALSYTEIAADSIDIILNNVTFDVASSNPTPSSYPELARVAHIIKKNKFKADIECHMDGKPGDSDNLNLTRKRAAAIRDILIQHGCRPSDLFDIGLGSDYPLPLDKSNRTRPRQRRTVIRLY